MSHRAFVASRPRFSSLLALLLVCLGAFWVGLGALPLVGPDEPRYAEVAREMWASGDWISPRLCGALWFEKPALTYWLQAAGYSVFGVGEFAARWGAALGATLCVLALCVVLTRAGLARLGVISGLVLGSCALWLGLARAASTDMPFSAALFGAFLCGWSALRPAAKSRFWSAIACGAFLGLAMLAKGLAGVLLPVLVLGIFAALQQRRDEIAFPLGKSALTLLSLSGACALVAATWYWPVYARHGSQFWEEFIIRQHFARFASNKYHHPQPVYFYIFIALVGVFPWSFFLVSATGRALASWKSSQSVELAAPAVGDASNAVRASLRRFAWIWALVVIGFFSASTAKLPGYILPAFPALAILIALEIETLWPRLARSWPAWATLCALALAAPLLVVLAHGQGAIPGNEVNLAALIPLGAAIFGFWSLKKNAARGVLIATGAVLPLVATLAGLFVFNHVGAGVSYKPLAVRIGRALRPREMVWYFKLDKQFATDFYTQGRVVAQGRNIDESSAKTTGELVEWLARHPDAPGLIVITRSKSVAQLQAEPRLTVRAFDKQEKFVAFRVALKASP